ncbi:actin-related protein 10 [Paragonimus westermani]|uniref:Actin-related protein 10 n=1 Tax=Paragonimus westermani TaxID=34504 RepID=A0A5J4N7N5_9TREM|nr:actin-related protein 10 [Paragonimus westermani]KAA3671453.1 actin-related protein 10 [Paragonimus westermani]
MPGFESLLLGEKTAVVFDIGSAYTKCVLVCFRVNGATFRCGFAGEPGPRFIFPTEITQPNGQARHLSSLKTAKEKRKFFITFFHNLYYRHLLVNPKDRRVVVVEGILGTTELRDIIADVLYNHFEIPSALFAPAHLVTLFTLGLSTALVLDCGHKEAVVIPVSEGYTLLNSWQADQLGSQAIYNNYSELLIKEAFVIDQNGNSAAFANSPGNENLVTTNLLEDLTVRTCFVSPASRAEEWQNWLIAQATGESVPAPKVAEDYFEYPLSHGGYSKRLRIPSRLRELSCECLFRGDNDQITLATLILKSIQACPVDLRKPLAKNLVLTGGTVNLPGFAARLLEELDRSLDLTDFTSLSALKGTFRIHQPPGEPNYIAWLGGKSQ